MRRCAYVLLHAEPFLDYSEIHGDGEQAVATPIVSHLWFMKICVTYCLISK